MKAETLAGYPINRRSWTAGDADLGGLKVITNQGWFAASLRHEDVYKLYSESFLSADHPEQIIWEAKQIVLPGFGLTGGARLFHLRGSVAELRVTSAVRITGTSEVDSPDRGIVGRFASSKLSDCTNSSI